METVYRMLRLKPGSDVKQSLIDFCHENSIQSGCIVSAVGSLSSMVVRVSDGKSIKEDHQDRELIHLSGTITEGSVHIHLAAISSQMDVFGGHLMKGCIVHTTLEVTLLDLSEQYENKRVFDSETGFDELEVIKK